MNEERMYKILLAAHISEKATVVAETGNHIAFKVVKDATRPEIKKAVEAIYGVNVLGVSVLNVKGKVKRNARGVSKKASWKKAYVRLAEGQDIDFASVKID